MWISKKEYMRLNAKIDGLSSQYNKCQRDWCEAIGRIGDLRVDIQNRIDDLNHGRNFPIIAKESLCRPSIWELFAVILDHLNLELRHQKAEFTVVKKEKNK